MHEVPFILLNFILVVISPSLLLLWRLYSVGFGINDLQYSPLPIDAFLSILAIIILTRTLFIKVFKGKMLIRMVITT